MGIINLKDIVKIYGKDEAKTEALKSVNLSIEKGEMVAIIGPSGSGKSTLLNIVGCIDGATSGEYILDEVNVSDLDSLELSKVRNKKIGFIFQNFNLLYDYNLIDNVGLPLSYSDNKKNIKTRAIEMLEKVDLKDHIDKTPDKLSGGQKQRVAIARALVNQPEIILADEPTGALDKKTGEKILELLQDINKQGKTVIIITHDNNVAQKCKRIIKIEDGLIVSDEAN